jgi:hypothetical protein
MTFARASVLRVLSQYSILDHLLTLIEIHKLLYFLQVSGEQLKLRFAKGIYGPYADNLRHVLHTFEGHFTSGFGEGRDSPETPIQLLPGALDEAEEFMKSRPAEAAETAVRYERVTELIEGFESPYGMELLASVHWVATQPEEGGKDLDSILVAIANWNDRKRQVMKPPHVRIAWERLRSKNWLPG